jgi:hypothetical protein
MVKTENIKFSNISKEPKNLIYLALSVLIVFPLYRYIRNQINKNKEQSQDLEIEQKKRDMENPTSQITAANKITSNANLHAITKNIAHHLGFIYDWYDPRRWSENDEQCFAEFVKLKSRAELQLIVKLYFEVYAVGRNLQIDCQKVLDAKYYKRITW